MKKILTLVAILHCFAVDAQMSKDSLIQIMTKEACEELNNKDLSNINGKNFEAEIGMLLVPTMMNHLDDIERIYGGGMEDQEAMKKMGADLGMRLTIKCPKFMEMTMSALKGGKNPIEPNSNKSALKVEFAEESMSGTLLAINAGDITTLSVSQAKGKVTKLYWLEYFENADELKANNKKYLNKKVKVNYTEKSVYDFVRKNYKTINVITSIELE